MEKKAIWKSKTLWVNIIAVSALFVQQHTGFVVSAEIQCILLGVVNTFLRMVTKAPLNWPSSLEPKEPGFIRLQLLLPLAFLLAFIFAALSGCATTSGTTEPVQITTGKALLAVRQTIITTRDAFGPPCQKGIVDRATCQRVDELYHASMLPYDAAVDAAVLAINTGSDKASADYITQKQLLDQLAGEITALAIKYAVGVPNANQ